MKITIDTDRIPPGGAIVIAKKNSQKEAGKLLVFSGEHSQVRQGEFTTVVAIRRPANSKEL